MTVAHLRRLAFCVWLGLCASWVWGATPTQSSEAPARNVESGPRWSDLTPMQHAALAPLRQDWSGIDADRKRKWMEVAAKFPSMTPDDRSRVQDRMAEWARLSPAERGRARLQFQETRKLSPKDRQERWEAYQSLPAEQRQALASAAVSSSAGHSKAGAAGSHPAHSASASGTRVVAPTIVQAKPGASTVLVSKTPAAVPAVRPQPGQPKIAAKRQDIDPATLLPIRGPQAAVAAVTPASDAETHTQ